MASLAAQHNFKIKQLDVASAYLNGDLEEEVYMSAPKGFENFLEDLINSEGDSKTGREAQEMLRESSTSMIFS